MCDNGHIFFTEEFIPNNKCRKHEGNTESPLEHHSNNYCKIPYILFLYIIYYLYIILININ